MKNTIVIGFILGCMAMIACQQEISTEGIDLTGIYTLDCIMGGDDTDSRAQIKLGKKESGGEEFFWNNEDSFALYQYKDGQLGSTTFKITDLYEESDSGKSTSASFKSETPSNEGRYVAVYPAHTPIENENALLFSFSHDLDFTDAITPEAKNEVWKQYIKDHMFMIAEGELKKNKYNIINFRHMCSLARITMTNETGKDMNIGYIKFGGKIFYETSRHFVMTPYYNYLGNSWCTDWYQVNTNNLTISSGETMDCYIFFLPIEFEEDAYMTIGFGLEGTFSFVYLSAGEIAEKNQGVYGFEAGKRYWFKVSNTLDGVVLSRDFEEFGLDGELITIDNPKFSNILQDKFGNKYITLNDEGNAVMHQSFADWVKELDLDHISGIETLAGLENFKNLERLSAKALMDLKEVDVSKNQALKYLNLSDNPNIKQLDLSQNTALDDLLLLNMPITSIDLSKNINIETGLLLVDLPITELDVSKNIKLKSFNCRSCRISDLDITSLTQLEKLYCGGQQEGITIHVYMTEKQKELWDAEWCHYWENANVVPIIKNEELVTVDNPALSTALLNMFGNKYITINNEGNAVIYKWFTDRIKELTFDGITGLETLIGIEYFSNLEKLSARNANLKSVDVSKNLALKYLDLSDNLDIQELDITQNLALEDLRLNNLSITQLDLSKNVKLTHLSCSGCKLTALDISSLVNLWALYCGNQQENLVVHVCMTNELQLRWVLYWMYYDENVNVMSFIYNDKLITFENPPLSKILYELYGNKYIIMNDSGNAIMYQSFANKIKELYLDGKKGLESLSGIEYFTNIEKISARDASLKAVDVSKNLSLKYLDLTGNPDIKQLDLSKNILLDDLQLTKMSISSIDLSSNVNLETGLLLVEMPITQLDLSKNVKLKQLNCRKCKISELDITPLPHLEKLYCGNQQDNITIHIYMTEKQKELWDAEWSKLREHINNVIPIVK